MRAAAADPERIVVCTGFAQGLGLVLRGARPAAVSGASPSRTRATDLAASEQCAARRAAGSTRCPCPSTSTASTSPRSTASGARAVVRHPGAPVADRRRARAASGGTRWWSGRPRDDGFVIEDDYDAEFRYDREPVGALQGLAPDRVFTIGTVSKSLAPAAAAGLGARARRALAERRRRRRSGSATAARPAWTSWRWPRCSSPAATTGTCAACARSTRGGAAR